MSLLHGEMNIIEKTKGGERLPQCVPLVRAGEGGRDASDVERSFLLVWLPEGYEIHLLGHHRASRLLRPYYTSSSPDPTLSINGRRARAGHETNINYIAELVNCGGSPCSPKSIILLTALI